MRKKFLLCILLFLCSILFSSEKIKIITTTSDIEYIVKVLGKGRIEVVNIVPPSLCPGHFELKLKDLAEIQKGRVILFHGWERWMENLKEGPERIRVEVDGNWMIPDINLKASEKILDLLLKIDPEGKEIFERNFSIYKKELENLKRECGGIKKGIEGLKVISSIRQKDFLSWLGMDVVSTFDDSEISLKEMKEIVERGRRENVKLVVDNLQRESISGRRIAEEIGAKYIVLTNFPNKNLYIESFLENLKKIEEALR